MFTREIEDALLDGTVDIAVHSLKDMPTRLPDGLVLAAVLERADPRDALVAPPGTRLSGLPPGARIGTSSVRRRAQLLARYPHLHVLDVRGNVLTRVAKLDEGQYDALLLAHAGLLRLGLDARVAEVIEPDVIVPAVGQGALAVEARAGDSRVASLVQRLDDHPTRLATCSERVFLARLDGGCQTPIGALATWAEDVMTLVGIVADLQGTRVVRGTVQAIARTESEAAAAGVSLADRLLQQGAAEILADVRGAGRCETGLGRDEP
jgi:hydroxymethylbilane synthase